MKVIVGVALLGMLALAVAFMVGYLVRDPCAALPAPTTGQRALAAQGARVEFTFNTITCVVDPLSTKDWVIDRG
jgi:hypothetical protein